MHIRRLGAGLHRSLKLRKGFRIVLQLVVCFAREHIRFRRLGIQGENLTVNVENTPVLFGAETALGKRQPERKVVGIGGRSLLQVRNRSRVFTHSVVGEPKQRHQAKRFRRGLGLLLKQGFQGLYRRGEIPSLEVRKTKIETQAWHLRVQAQSLLVEDDCLLVMRLARLQKTEMRICFSVIGLAAQERSPPGFGFGYLPLLLERERRLSPAFASRGLLRPTMDSSRRRQPQRADQSYKLSPPHTSLRGDS